VLARILDVQPAVLLAEATGLSLEMIGRLERGARAYRAIVSVRMAGERRESLDRINRLLASASDRELERAARVLSALLRE
jgi:hypothetical protein